MKRIRLMVGAVVVCAWFLTGCEENDFGMATTEERDFTVSLSVVDRFVHVGDQVAITLELKRTDNSNLEPGMGGEVILTTSSHGLINTPRVPLTVNNNTTNQLEQVVVFTATQSGVAEVRATFKDASALVKILIPVCLFDKAKG